MAAVGVSFKERGRVADDYLAAMRALWTQPKPSHHGPYVAFDGVQAMPRPVQTPVPIVVGGRTPPAYRRAVAQGHGWYGFAMTPEQTKESVAELQGQPLEQHREIRIDLPVRAFLPVRWVGQEALRLELYRRISTARDHDELERVRAEAEDRYGQFPEEVETLFAVASLRITCQRLGVDEVSTFRDEIRVRPVALEDSLEVVLKVRVPEATYHRTTQTLNVTIDQSMGGARLPGWVEQALVEATGRPAGRSRAAR